LIDLDFISKLNIADIISLLLGNWHDEYVLASLKVFSSKFDDEEIEISEFISDDGLEVIVKGLKSSNPAIQLQSCKLLEKISKKGSISISPRLNDF